MSKSKIKRIRKSEAERLARKIWRAGLGAYGAAYDTVSYTPDATFNVLSKRGKALEKEVRTRSGKTAAFAKLSRQTTTIGRQITKLSGNGPKAKKLKSKQRAALIKALGLNELTSDSAKRPAASTSHLEALEEKVAAFKAQLKALDGETANRLRRLSQELADIAGPAPLPNTDANGRLAEPEGSADDLKKIKGIGQVLEQKLNAAGIFHFWQVAALSDSQAEALESDMRFPGRIRRDDWRSQAQALFEDM